MAPTLNRVLVVVLCAAACVGQFQDGCKVAVKNKNANEAAAKYMSLCDGCVDRAYFSTVFALDDATAPSAHFTTFNVQPGVIALRAPNGKFLRRCPNCFAGKHTEGHWVADADDSAAAAAQLSVFELSAAVYALQGDNGQFVGRCYLCYMTTGMDTGVVYADSQNEIDAALEFEVLSCPSTKVCAEGFEVAFNGVAMPAVPVAGREDVVSVLPEVDVYGIPASFRTGSVVVPPLPVGEGVVVELRCCGDAACEFYVSVYRCRTCPAAVFNGGLPAMLLAMPASPFDAASCAPSVSFAAGRAAGVRYPMASFHTTVQNATAVTLPALTAEARILTIFATPPSAQPWCPANRNIGPVQDTACPCLA
ncbi:hypothetical protein DIPPA_20262 [Diplonema papillatum]|nr:hypothetical protein DIPPA_20262 [Diplonema papillatum]